MKIIGHQLQLALIRGIQRKLLVMLNKLGKDGTIT